MPPSLLWLCLLTCAALMAGSSSSSSSSSAYEVLESYGFPQGLLPQTVDGYTLDPADGSFSLSLCSSCTVLIPDAYPVRYAPTIAGTIQYGSLTDLSGITVKVFFAWWDITSISVSGDDLVFRVGPASASYPVLNFDENPGCEGTSRPDPVQAFWNFSSDHRLLVA